MPNYELHLNLLVVKGDVPPFTIYRKSREVNERANPHAGVFAYDLPVESADLSVRGEYLVRLAPQAGYTACSLPAAAKIDLTRRVLFEALKAKCSQVFKVGEYSVPEDTFHREFSFILARHHEGNEVIVLQPYYLGATKQFGFLVDFHFDLNPGVPFSRRIQQLSLSLDQNYRRNLDYYADRRARITGWIQSHHAKLFPLPLPGASAPVGVESKFTPLPALQLRAKTYVMDGNREYRSQFIGVKEAGPLEPVAACPPLLFVFREQDRGLARRLARALKGAESQLNFPGFEQLFHLPITISSSPVVVNDFSRAEMERAIAQVQGANENPAIPVVVMPKDEEAYITHKAVFTHAGIATQVCTTDTLNDDYALKWSVANIALQLFCKAGGKPWKVKPTEFGSLIVGVSQSHKVTGHDSHRHIEKYFAFSILTDSSGIFQSLNVIGQADREADYLRQLRDNLANLLREQAERFRTVVLHTSFKLKHTEMEVIESVVKAAAAEKKCRFAVVKVNQRNRFFAINPKVNSFVPYEASYVRLGHREYLLWFEGVFPDNPSVKKAFPGPTHLEFLHVSEEKMIGDEQVLQDLVNLSGANWRGFNAKSAPVSIFYCHLVADLIRRFQERDLPLPEVKELRPWFL
ncbi:MAG: piwi domain protein [Verrucomicrobia bacterium]|nr:piwi domain protein [Verrucomicrobiota bacterium]